MSCNSAVVPANVAGAGVAVRAANLPSPAGADVAVRAANLPSPAAAVAPEVLANPSAGAGFAKTSVDEREGEGKGSRVQNETGHSAPQSPPEPPSPAIVSPHDPPLGVTPPATQVNLGPLEFISQTVNNCGPASVAEVLKFWGIDKSQEEVQSVLRGDGNPYGMTPAGVPGYMQALGMNVVLGTAGSEDLVKDLLRDGFPVIVNQTVSQADPALHYRPVQGFDDAKGVFTTSDPLQGPNYAISYPEFDQDWKYTGQRFIVIYPSDKQDQLNAALAAANWDSAYAEGGGQSAAWSVPTNGPAPVTTPALDGNGKQPVDGWYPAKVTVTFKAADPSGFGVAATTYAIDKQPPALYRGPFAIDGAGKHALTFYSVNFAGSREKDQTAEIDIGPPPSPTPAPLPQPPSPKPSASASAAPSATPTPAPSASPARPYKVCQLFDANQPQKGATELLLKFQLCDPNNTQKNLSSAQLTLSAQGMVMFPSNVRLAAPGPLRFDNAGGAHYEVDVPPGLSTGTYVLYFTATGDSVLHSIQFRIG